MGKAIVENDQGGIWYGNTVEPHVKNTIHDEIKDPLIEISSLRDRIIKIETKIESQDEFERKLSNKSNKIIAIITTVITLIVGIPGIISLIIQLASKR